MQNVYLSVIATKKKHTEGFLLFLFTVRCFKKKFIKVKSYALWSRLRGYKITSPRGIQTAITWRCLFQSPQPQCNVRITIDLDTLKNLEAIMDTEPGSKLFIQLLHISQLFQKCFQMRCLYFKAASIKVKSLPVADFNSCL